MESYKNLKNEYKLKKFRKGIFRIRNISNGKIFISSGKDLDKNWNSHKFRLKMGMHESKSLQNDWNKYGEEYFVYEVISELKDRDDINADYDKELKDLEELYLQELLPYEEKGYNKQKQTN